MLYQQGFSNDHRSPEQTFATRFRLKQAVAAWESLAIEAMHPDGTIGLMTIGEMVDMFSFPRNLLERLCPPISVASDVLEEPLCQLCSTRDPQHVAVFTCPACPSNQCHMCSWQAWVHKQSTRAHVLEEIQRRPRDPHYFQLSRPHLPPNEVVIEHRLLKWTSKYRHQVDATKRLTESALTSGTVPYWTPVFEYYQGIHSTARHATSSSAAALAIATRHPAADSQIWLSQLHACPVMPTPKFYTDLTTSSERRCGDDSIFYTNRHAIPTNFTTATAFSTKVFIVPFATSQVLGRQQKINGLDRHACISEWTHVELLDALYDRLTKSDKYGDIVADVGFSFVSIEPQLQLASRFQMSHAELLDSSSSRYHNRSFILVHSLHRDKFELFTQMYFQTSTSGTYLDDKRLYNTRELSFRDHAFPMRFGLHENNRRSYLHAAQVCGFVTATYAVAQSGFVASVRTEEGLDLLEPRESAKILEGRCLQEFDRSGFKLQRATFALCRFYKPYYRRCFWPFASFGDLWLDAFEKRRPTCWGQYLVPVTQIAQKFLPIPLDELALPPEDYRRNPAAESQPKEKLMAAVRLPLRTPT